MVKLIPNLAGDLVPHRSHTLRHILDDCIYLIRIEPRNTYKLLTITVLIVRPTNRNGSTINQERKGNGEKSKKNLANHGLVL